MTLAFESVPHRERLHTRIIETLARRVIQAAQSAKEVVFPKEALLCQQLGVSRTVLRESMKVLVDKGMVEMKPRAGTRSRPRPQWRLLDPDILVWQAEVYADASLLRDLCELRLAIEPTAAGFAAVRATPDELAKIESSLRERETKSGAANEEAAIDLDLSFHMAVVAASHSPLLQELSGIIRQPFRIALSITSRFPSTVALGLEAHHALLAALRKHDPLAARRAAEEIVGLAMLAVEEVTRSRDRQTSAPKQSA